ncbi:MAG: type 4a pilus biogenesis protein PilO [Candidatus Paceibacteria bacterium]
MLASLILIGGATFIVFNLALPKWRAVQALRIEKDEKIALRNQLAQISAKAQELLARFEDLDRQSEPIDRALPSEPRLPEMLAILSSLAAKNNLAISQVNFDDILTRPERALVEAHKAVPIKINVYLAGRYPDFKNWLRALESELRLIDVEELNIQSLSDKPGESTLSFSISLFTYWQPQPELKTAISQTESQ